MKTFKAPMKWTRPAKPKADPTPCAGISVDLSCPDLACLKCPRYKPKVNRTWIDEQTDVNEAIRTAYEY